MKKILLIEDNLEVRENTAEILELANFQVITAENGKIGVDKAMNENPDLIICDIMMPELDGFGVLHILSKNKNTARIPFIFLTAKTEKMDFRKGMNMGADDYLTKPFDDTELLDAIESRLRKREINTTDYAQNYEGINEFITDARAIGKLEDLSNERKKRTYNKKSEIFRKGDLPNYLFYILEGKIKEFKTNEDGKELIIGIYGKGEFFGYEALLENSEYRESSTAIENSELALIPKKDFFTLIYTNRDVANKFIEMLSNKVSEKEERLLNLAYNSVRQRTAEALLTLYEKYGNQPEITISRDDLAHMVGTATESVIRVLSDFKDENVIEIQSGKIRVTSPDKLNQIIRWNFAR
ncbi:MAG: response regulator [Cyclobacteriaceae bacterium]|nr:response regulator [Cyclobacteriaceae bacterium]